MGLGWPFSLVSFNLERILCSWSLTTLILLKSTGRLFYRIALYWGLFISSYWVESVITVIVIKCCCFQFPFFPLHSFSYVRMASWSLNLFRVVWSVAAVYCNVHIALDLAKGSPFKPLLCSFDMFLSFFDTFLFPGPTSCSMFILYFPSPGISHSSERPQFL